MTGKSQPAYDALDPRELMALTLADIWNLATDGKAIIIGQGGAIRATAGLVGRGACLVNARQGDRRQLQHARRGLGNQPGVLHDVGGAQGVQRQRGVGGGGRHVDGPRHRQTRRSSARRACSSGSRPKRSSA